MSELIKNRFQIYRLIENHAYDLKNAGKDSCVFKIREINPSNSSSVEECMAVLYDSDESIEMFRIELISLVEMVKKSDFKTIFPTVIQSLYLNQFTYKNCSELKLERIVIVPNYLIAIINFILQSFHTNYDDVYVDICNGISFYKSCVSQQYLIDVNPIFNYSMSSINDDVKLSRLLPYTLNV